MPKWVWEKTGSGLSLKGSWSSWQSHHCQKYPSTNDVLCGQVLKTVTQELLTQSMFRYPPSTLRAPAHL